MGEFQFSLRALCQQELDKQQRKALHCHFSLRRKSGGGECQTSHLAGREYRISFQDPADRDRVLAKERHIFKAGGESLEVLVRAEEQEEEGLLEEAREPKNDSASRLQSFLFQLDPYLLRFLQEHPEVSEILQQGLLKYHCTWSLPTEEKESEKERQILLSGSIDIPFQKWKSQVEDVLATFKQQYVCFYEFNLEKQQKLVGDAGLAKKSISIYHEPLQHFIVITGLARDVEELVDTMDLALLGQRNVISSTCSLGHPNKFSIIQEDLERELNLHFPKLQFCITQNKMDLKGTTEEVLWAQEKFQELLMDVKEHLIEVSLHKRQFLCSLHLADFSSSLFGGLCGRVTLDITQSVTLFGKSFHLLKEAENILQSAIREEEIKVEEDEKSSIQTPAWTNFLSSAEKEVNHPLKRVQVNCHKDPKSGCLVIIIVGYSDAIDQMKQKMEDHLKSSVVVQEEVMLKNPIIKQRFPDLLKIINIEDINPRTRFLKSSNQSILLQGSKAEVTRVKKALEKNLGNLKHEILTLPSPGASEFFTENGQEYLATIERRNNCITTWSCRDALNIGGTQSRPQEEDFITDTWCIFQLEGGYIVSVCQGDITKQRVDAIVNAANEDLIHAGGVAQAISMAGGPVIQKESRDWVKHRGKVLTGQAAITSAGTLPCQKVIHAVGPKCKADGKGKWDHSQNEGLLKSAITRSLMLAEQGNFRSVALPCLSSGIFGIPVVLCATWIVEAIKVHTEAYARVDHALREVMLIDVKKETVAEFQTACVKNWGSRISSLHSKDSNQSHTGRPQAAEVVFISGNLEEQLANVLVVPVLAKNPTLTSMRVGECLLKKIGGNFGALFSMLMKGRQLDPGNLLQVNTSVNDHVCCQAVLILMCSPWDGANGAAAKALRNGFSSCLHKCDHLKVKSVAFPVIGPGLTLKFPRDVVARIFFEEVKMFRGAHPGTALEEIQIVIHPEDLHSLSVFQDTQREVDMKGRPLPTSPEEGLLSCLVDDIQAMVGGVRLQVVFSDIVKETTDVIVNSTNFQSWNSQSVANAIFSATNPEIAEEVKKAKLPVDEVFVTASGGLQCRQLFHVCGQNKAQNIKSVVKKVMRKCEEIGFSSVAFPAIGTGEGKMEPGVVATAMLDAVLSVARCESLNSLKHVRIVAFQQAVFNALKWELQNRVGHLDKSKKKIISGLLKSLKSRLLKTVPQKNEMFESPRTHSEVVFEILGLSSSSIEAAKREIEEVFQKNYRDEVLQVESIARLRTEEIQQILGLGEAFRVHVTVERGQVNRIRLQGYEKQVMEVLREVMEKLKYLLESHLEEVEWERLSMLVQWMYQKDEEYLPLDPRANCLLEIGLSEQVPGQPSTVQVSLGGEEAQADLSRMEATIVRTRAVVKLKREDRALGFNNPAKWDAMSGQLLTLVDLGQGTQEFRDVQQNFMRTANGHHIIKVQRIQNLHLRHVYELRKEYIAEKNGQGELNERVLFHGTMPETCASINLYGFNRSYAGQNATAYGVGVYFAVHASYSANNTYSKPDPQTRHKFMYQVRVVAGRYTTGNSSMKVPPARPGTDPNDRYDSLVDKIENPTMYVVFHDDQAYPEYLITFM